MSSHTLPSTFLKNIAKNGIGRHVCQLQRVTLSFCKSHPGSLGARDFIENHLLDFTKSNPGIVVYLNPKRHRIPALKAEFLNGHSEKILLHQMTSEEIAQWFGHMRGRSGVQIQRLRKDWHTDTPSIQGMWHPFMFKDTAVNVSDVRDKKLHEYVSPYKNATEKLLEQSEQLFSTSKETTTRSSSDLEGSSK